MSTLDAGADTTLAEASVAGKPVGRIRLAVIAPHPVQYHAPLYRSICRHPAFDAKIIYLDTLGLEGIFDVDFRTKLVWDTPLLDGHAHEFVKNFAVNNHLGFLARINPGLYRVLSRGRYDAVFIQGYATLSNWIALVAARLLGQKVIWRGEVTERADRGAGIARSVKDSVLGAFFKQCDALLYTSEGNRQFLRRYTAGQQQLFPFLCAVDNDYFRAAADRHAPEIQVIKQELDIPPDDLVVLYCGRLNENKRVIDALNAIKIAGAEGITFVIMGDGPLREALLAHARQQGVRVRHLGFTNQSMIGRYYAVADVFTLLSGWYDHSPKSLNEAMNFNLVPVVSERVGTAKDLIEEGVTGFLVRPGDVETIATRLMSLKADPARRNVIARAARDRVARFSFEANADGLAAACRFALAKSALPRTEAAG